MSTSSKFDLSSASPDRPLYSSGHRGSYATASLDRSGSFRENMENQILSSLPNMARSSSSVTHGDVTNFFKCVHFDPELMVVDHKLNRPVAFKRLATAAIGIPVEDPLSGSSNSKPLPSPSSDDLRRLKAGVREGGIKARERVKIFNDCLSVINKWFPTIPPRKRSRLDILSNDRLSALLPTDRSSSGMSMSKMGSQSHASTSSLGLEQQRSEERTKISTKISIPNKRTRTSMVDPRANAPSRLAGVMEKDGEILRLPNSGGVNGDDRTSSLTIDGWEKSKMKKKRTGIKTEATASSTVMKSADGYRESKQVIQPQLPTDARSRMSDSYGTRPGIANGSVRVGKAESSSQQTGLGTRLISRAEQDNSPLLHERRERPTAPEKERLNLKAVNKANASEDFSSGSPTSSSKLNANARARRSGTEGGISKLSQVVQWATASNDWELSNCTSKLPGSVGANNHKRKPSTRSSSPPVANWVQRPQKISRTARRTNIVPIVLCNDETLTVDTMSEVMRNERRMPGHSPGQSKLKSEFSSAVFSESEESGAAEAKPRDKNKKFDEMDEKCGQNIHKMSTLPLPPRKNKAASGEDHGDGVQRQGRSVRGFTSTRSLMTLAVEKHGNVGTIKQIRSSRFGFEKNERAGRPPTRKPSDRKPYTRQKHTVNIAPDFVVGSDDGNEELLAAANAVTNTAQALSSSFWRKMEPLYRLISDTDIAYLQDQVNLCSTVDTPALVPLDADVSALIHNASGSNDPRREESGTEGVELSPEHLALGASTPTEISLYQTLIAALIPEERNQELCISGNEDFRSDVYGSCFETEKDMDSDTFHSPRSQNRDISRYSAFNGYRINANGEVFYELDPSFPDHNGSSIDSGIIPVCNHLQNGLLSHQIMPGLECSEYQYNNMSINERLLVEIHSIGLYPDLGPDLCQNGDEEISGDLSRLDEKYQEEVSRKKSMLGKLLNSASEDKERQENLFERCALEKLVGLAYEKYMTCWGPNAHGMKSASGKMAKQAALAFVNRTLEQCQEFDATGKSCFGEPLYKEIFHSGVAHLGDIQAVNSSADNESGKRQFNTSGCSIEVRTSAPLGAQHSPYSNNQEIYSSGAPKSANLGSEQTTGKDDIWSNRLKKCELQSDEIVGGTLGSSTSVPSGIGSSLSSSAKGKRSEREGKGNSREALSRSGSTKVGRAALANVKGERKPKTKPRQKTGQLTASVNGPLGKMSERQKTTLFSAPISNERSGSGTDKDKNDDNIDLLEDPIDLSGLQLPGMGDLGVTDDLAGQGEDLGSWLNNIEDDVLQDHDYMGGLEIPMDDLADLNMMV